MTILLVWGPKGGIGKTTLAIELVVAARLAGFDAAGLDLDPQASLTRWASDRAAGERLPAIEVTGGRLSSWRDTLPSAALVVVDTPPGLGEPAEMAAARRLGRAAALVLIPALPQGPTLRSMADLARELMADVHPVFVLNATIPGRAALVEARAYLRERGELCSVELPARDHVQRAHDVGAAVVEDTRLGGHQQARELWSFAASRMGLV